MKTFSLHLQSATQYECIADVTSFVGEDDSGSFGLLADHAPMMTILTYGLARYRREEGPWIYLALPGGVGYFRDNALFISTRRYYRDADYEKVSAVLIDQLMREEAALRQIREGLAHLEQDLVRRLRQIDRT